jgi:nicotinate-nucleotide adenylyltransferase
VSSPGRTAFPNTSDGLRIGLQGGSFNPPHAAHLQLSLLALKRLQLDRVWWLVSPGNPLKDTRELPSLETRLEAARKLAAHPAIDVTGLEAALDTRFTVDTITALRRRFPNVRFVWLMGADGLAQFHRWRDWERIAAQIPIAVIDRPPDSFRALASPAAQALSKYRHNEQLAPRLAGMDAPAWIYLHGMKSPLSSTELRSHTKASS